MQQTIISLITAFIIIIIKVFNSTSYKLVGIGLTHSVCIGKTYKQVASLNGLKR